jgi:hypothetical protein
MFLYLLRIRNIVDTLRISGRNKIMSKQEQRCARLSLVIVIGLALVLSVSITVSPAIAKSHKSSSGLSSSTNGGVSSSGKGGLRQIPSNATDYPANEQNTIKVTVTGAHKDIIGAWHVTGEVTNMGTQTLSFVKITAHLYDGSGNLIGDATGYTDPSNLDAGHTGTFDCLATSDQIQGTPASYRLSYDWS